MNVPFNDLKREYRSIKQEIDPAIQEVIDNTAFVKGRYLASFEEKFADYNSMQFAIGTSSGTTALHAALFGFGIGPGDEVITVSHTFIGTTEPITHAGAKIVFVDIDPVTCTIDPGKIEQAITPHTKAIIPVHLYGQIADMEAVCDIARKHNLVVIEDAAQAIGAECNDRKAGQYGDAACYSFYPGKNLGAYGDGGMVVTNNEDAAKKIRMLVDHGRMSKYLHEFEGYNYRMDALQAAVLGVKLNHIDNWNRERVRVAEFYRNHLSDIEIGLPVTADGAYHVFHVYCARVKNRESLQPQLKERGIATGIHYPVPLHLQPAYEHLGCKKGSLPVTEAIVDEILSLPIFPFMSDDELHYTVEVLRELIS